MKLPERFINKMRPLLGEEFENFIDQLDCPGYAGLRVNRLKCTAEEFKAISPLHLESVPWTTNGFYYPTDQRPAKHPYHFAGLYYIQEPSAMAPAAILGAQPGEKVLDLCAAPGGKTTELAACLQGQGVLVANDLSNERIRPLVKNLERFGVTNAIVTHEPPDRLAARFPNYFDRILVDAPCSGEGMFRKDPEAVESWSVYSCEDCAARQDEILEQAARMLKTGGKIVYSTCTFSPEEDEYSIDRFLQKHPNFEIVDIPKQHGFTPGFVVNGRAELTRTVRLWPHKLRGEGHFVALLRKVKMKDEKTVGLPKSARLELDTYFQFVAENLREFSLEGTFTAYREHLYLAPSGLPSLDGLKVIRPGLYLGQLKKNRFEPSHALALALKPRQAKYTVNLSASSPEVLQYLKAGSFLERVGEKGWVLVCVDGYPLGWAKQTAAELKNYYPISWRWVD